MNTVNDLTRWNRAGLQRFRYVDGNAVTYLEFLRQELKKAFPDWRRMQAEETLPPEANRIIREMFQARNQERLLKQYHQAPGSWDPDLQEEWEFDWGFEIARTLARACHILTEYADAYTNEGFIGTATQWDNVRKLVALLDYHPAPPASAETFLVLQLKPGKKGVVKTGLQIRYQNNDGRPPVVFETLRDLEADAACNSLHLAGWNHSPETFGDTLLFGADRIRIPLEREEARIIQGVGNHYYEMLCRWYRNPKKPFTVKDLACLDSRFVPGISEVRLEEFITKARLLLHPPFDIRRYEPVADLTLAEVAEITPARLADKTNRTEKDGIRLIKWLHTARITLDEPAFQQIKLRQLFPANLEDSDPPEVHPEPGTEKQSSWVMPPESKISAGQIALILTGFGAAANGAVVGIAEIEQETGRIFFENKPGQPDWRSWRKGETVLFAEPGRIYQPVFRSVDAVELETPHGLTKGDVIAWQEGALWKFNRVVESEEKTFQLALPDYPGVGRVIYKAYKIERPAVAGAVLSFSNNFRTVAHGHTFLPLIPDTDYRANEHNPQEFLLTDRKVKLIYIVAKGIKPIGTVVPASGRNRGNFFAGSPAGLQSGKWMAGENQAGGFQPLCIKEVRESEEGFQLLFSQGDPDLKRLYGPFKMTLHPEQYDRNPEPLFGNIVYLDGEDFPEVLKKGRSLVLEREDGGTPVVCSITAVNPEERSLHLSCNLEAGSGFTIGNTIIRGNVALAGHGERKPERILGSGEAIRSSQSFILDVPGISFISDPLFPSGVRADIEITIYNQIWTQVPGFQNQRPTDAVYRVEMTEEGYLKVFFGDGMRGRRLPTGVNNIRVRYRQGAGTDGNLPPGSLNNSDHPHPWLVSVSQPFPATGGNEMESIHSIRENAPASVLTLGRAVSLSDFAHLAMSRSGIWQATAIPQIPGRGQDERIEVIVVPAGGGSLGELESSLKQFLKAHALPGVEIRVSPYIPVELRLAITVRVDTGQYEPEMVVKRVRLALTEAFSLRQRKLGQPVYLSDVYRVVEAAEGVINSVCTMDVRPGMTVKKTTRPGEVIYLPPDSGDLTIQWKEGAQNEQNG